LTSLSVCFFFQIPVAVLSLLIGCVTLIEGGWVQAGSEFTFTGRSGETVVATFETPYVSRSSDNAILTFDYKLMAGSSPTLKVFAHCDGSASDALINLGQGGSEFSLEGSVPEYTSQCLAVQYFIQEANTPCDLFKIVFEGSASSTPSAEPSVNVQNIKFRSSDVVGTADCEERNNR
jgi:hypothetical protein